MADDRNIVVTLIPQEPETLVCGGCDGALWHVYDDGSMVCADKDCGAKTRLDLFKDD